MCEKWYKYTDKCPGCGTEFRRRDTYVYLACEQCGVMVSVPSYRESEEESSFVKHSDDEGKLVPMTIAHFCDIQRLVAQAVERLSPRV